MLSIICIILISVGFIVLSSNYSLPNYWSLLVIIPTGLLIVLGYKNSTIIHKALGSIVLKHIGLWSFSIYLVHWTLLSFYKYITGLHISLLEGLILIVISNSIRRFIILFNRAKITL